MKDTGLTPLLYFPIDTNPHHVHKGSMSTTETGDGGKTRTNAGRWLWRLVRWLGGDARLRRQNKRLRARLAEMKRHADWHQKRHHEMNEAFRDKARRNRYAAKILDELTDLPK